jgi:phosphoglycerol transferase MdoB-like AlkP superfamily enzyme
MYKERFGFAVQHYAVSHLLLAGLFWLIRLFEFFSVMAVHAVPGNAAKILLSGMAFDLWLCFVLALLMFPVYTLLYLLIGPIIRYLLFIAFVAYLSIHLALVSYYVITQIPLGVDFWGYSMADIRTTVNSSAGVSVTSLLPFAVLIGLLLYSYPRAQELMMPRWSLIVFYTLMVGGSVAYIVKTPAMSWFANENSYTLSINKLAYFGEKTLIWYSDRNNEEQPAIAEYPFMKDADTADVLSPFFTPLETKPNLVFVMVEGLGGTFVGPNARYGGCTPFLDSLAQHSLYWQYTLSATGRTFGVLPSLFGSLPYSERGFMETAPDMPEHLTMISLLKEQGYTTRYFYGGNANFDLQDVFLEAQGIDYILEENKFPATYKKTEATSEGFSWGYSDQDLFKRSLEVLPAKDTQPYLSIYMTISTHEPFKVPGQEKYLAQLDKIVAAKPADKQAMYKEFSKEFSSLLFTDNALRSFFEQYKKREDYANTIFVITGDHRMIPVTQSNRIDRFHVPLIVFSPKLSRAETFSAVNTHQDITPTFLSFLEHQTGMLFPQKVHWLGSILDTTREFHSIRKMPLMRNKNELIDYIDGDYFMSDNVAYKITPKLDLEPLNDNDEQTQLKKELEGFKQKNQYVFKERKLYKNDQGTVASTVKREFLFSQVEQAELRRLGTDSLNPEQLFGKAQKSAKAKRYDEARLICKKALILSPNYTDIRLLLGRTYLWEGDYDMARKCFEESIRRSPTSGQSKKALIEIETKMGNYREAIRLADEGYKQLADEDFLKLKKIAIEESTASKRKI